MDEFFSVVVVVQMRLYECYIKDSNGTIVYLVGSLFFLSLALLIYSSPEINV